MSVEVKICGLCRPEDARLACEAGADYLGVVLAPSRRHREPGEARLIWGALKVRRAGVFIDPAEDELAKLAKDLRLDVVQLHGSEDPMFCRRVREAGDWSVWKAIRLREGTGLEIALQRYAEVVDGVLLEGWSTEGVGGVGARFDWSRIEDVRARWPRGLRLILAGGLNHLNVGAAIDAVRPDVVDVSSGVEAELGRKDPAGLRAFVDRVRRARTDDD